ncbi:unnamed protein product [Ilex paraguariensis]|uniref:Uncharacterized protein n=1 Tax=Ilex paraguariensis TaxID=185542 RepID=A0ABC8RNU5_9AQUA
MASRRFMSPLSRVLPEGLFSWFWACVVFVLMLGLVLVGMEKIHGVSSLSLKLRASRKEKGTGKAMEKGDGDGDDEPRESKARKNQTVYIIDLCQEVYMRLKDVDSDLMILRTIVRGILATNGKKLGAIFGDAEEDIYNFLPRDSLPVLPLVTPAGATSLVTIPPTSIPEPSPVVVSEPRDPRMEIESSEAEGESNFDESDEGDPE